MLGFKNWDMKFLQKQRPVVKFIYFLCLLIAVRFYQITLIVSLVLGLMWFVHKHFRCKLCNGTGKLYGWLPQVEAHFDGYKCYCCKGNKYIIERKNGSDLLEKVKKSKSNLSEKLKNLRGDIASYKKRCIQSPLIKNTRIEQVNRKNMIEYFQREDLFEKCLNSLELVEKKIHLDLLLMQQLEVVELEQMKLNDRYEQVIEDTAVVSEVNMEMNWLENDLPRFALFESINGTELESDSINSLIDEVNGIISETKIFLKVA